MNHAKSQTGFTLVELLLSMSFIAVLLLSIATVTLMLSRVYNSGLTVKEVNEISRTVTNDVANDISNSATFSLKTTDTQYVNTNPNGTIGQAPSGRLCLGTYTYVWNYGWALSQSNSGVSVYNGKNDEIRLVRVPDSNEVYCQHNAMGALTTPKIDPTNAVELISGTDHDLVIHQLAVNSSATASDPVTGEQLYSVTFTIGTNNQAALQVDPTSGQLACKPPSIAGADLEYCTLQQFSLVARTQHGVN
jgi:Tfp pilus assembly protein FimT